MSFYEGPSTDPELIELTQRQPIEDHRRDAAGFAGAGRWLAYIRTDRRSAHRRGPDVQSMLHVGLDVIRS